MRNNGLRLVHAVNKIKLGRAYGGFEWVIGYSTSASKLTETFSLLALEYIIADL